MAAENARAPDGQAPSACRPTDRDLRRCMASDLTTAGSQAGACQADDVQACSEAGLAWQQTHGAILQAMRVLMCTSAGRVADAVVADARGAGIQVAAVVHVAAVVERAAGVRTHMRRQHGSRLILVSLLDIGQVVVLHACKHACDVS